MRESLYVCVAFRCPCWNRTRSCARYQLSWVSDVRARFSQSVLETPAQACVQAVHFEHAGNMHKNIGCTNWFSAFLYSSSLLLKSMEKQPLNFKRSLMHAGSHLFVVFDCKLENYRFDLNGATCWQMNFIANVEQNIGVKWFVGYL